MNINNSCCINLIRTDLDGEPEYFMTCPMIEWSVDQRNCVKVAGTTVCSNSVVNLPHDLECKKVVEPDRSFMVASLSFFVVCDVLYPIMGVYALYLAFYQEKGQPALPVREEWAHLDGTTLCFGKSDSKKPLVGGDEEWNNLTRKN
ncbi:hypothetical protein EIN_136560 [Entamoeba invadens IP1]|uniref:Uncharacterized protein n=1 Tax=Entamoeba invadens IP1 TaxID=370355 RepID=A0A0A1TXG4_ENTIV|nr:hypothetical protein EIN_136560 [Entamoeba invadens IP1]ELP85982.1 hypothetical protein EIN_136560 [Entamoeba invadens IP1]|eukprot:XP_004185328.1 hypothetical protein EIN_136560 [Entamoeba invadens IP1]